VYLFLTVQRTQLMWENFFKIYKIYQNIQQPRVFKQISTVDNNGTVGNA
jgi:hypothetical protein